MVKKRWKSSNIPFPLKSEIKSVHLISSHLKHILTHLLRRFGKHTVDSDCRFHFVPSMTNFHSPEKRTSKTERIHEQSYKYNLLIGNSQYAGYIHKMQKVTNLKNQVTLLRQWPCEWEMRTNQRDYFSNWKTNPIHANHGIGST